MSWVFVDDETREQNAADDAEEMPCQSGVGGVQPEAMKVDVTIDYLGFDIPNDFVVGYGLDYAESYRSLSGVGVLKPSVYGGS